MVGRDKDKVEYREVNARWFRVMSGKCERGYIVVVVELVYCGNPLHRKALRYVKPLRMDINMVDIVFLT